jgi:putative NADPH-quinone reductase
MARNIVIIQGHPDAAGGHLCHSLADAYADGAAGAGHEIRRINVAGLAFSMLRTREEWLDAASASPDIAAAQQAIAAADHIVIIYPLWLGTMPALLKAFLEQVLRPGFAIGEAKQGQTWAKKLKGKSARIIITMGMPALVYRWYFGAHSLRSLERNILAFCGIGPVRDSLVGLVENMSSDKSERWLEKMRRLGRAAR